MTLEPKQALNGQRQWLWSPLAERRLVDPGCRQTTYCGDTLAAMTDREVVRASRWSVGIEPL